MKFADSLRNLLQRPAPQPEPAEKPAPQQKKVSRFTEMCEQGKRRVGWWREIPREAETGARIGVLVSPWISTGVPFFSIECALMLAQRGAQVSVLWDGAEIVGNVPEKKHVNEIAEVLRELPEWIERIDIEKIEAAPNAADEDRAKKIVHENAVRAARGETNVTQFLAEHPNAVADTQRHIARIRSALAAQKFDWLLIPGGIFGISAVYVAIAKERRLDFSTFDSGPGRLRLTHRGVAAHLADLPEAYRAVVREVDALRLQTLIREAKEELEARATATDERGFQVAPKSADAKIPCDILIPLNIRWDSAALSRQRLFASVEECIASVLEWSQNQPDLRICIRQHPNERHEHLRGSDNFQHLIERFSGLGERVRWIGAADEINTYDLLRVARVVLPHTSTVGVEAALLGRPVILATSVYYENFSFVWKAATREEFFALIDRALRGELALTGVANDEAGIVYYLTQKCAAAKSAFTPQNDDFPKWANLSPDKLWSRPEVDDFRAALLSREPFAQVRQRHLAAS